MRGRHFYHGAPLQVRPLALAANIRLGSKGFFSGMNTLAYFVSSLAMKEKVLSK
jgi:hypothetical protein